MPDQQNRTLRLWGIIIWSLLPCAAIWIGLHQIKSAAWTFALYHGLCLIPAIIWGRSRWTKTMIAPSLKTCLVLIAASFVFTIIALLTYELLGERLLSNDHVIDVLKELGYSKSIFWPISIYAIVVNPVLEELFWRGVVLNELDSLKLKNRHFGIVWSSCAYALFHYAIFAMVMFPVWAEIGSSMLAVYGAFLALVYRKTGSIITTAIAHSLLTDLACIVLILDLFRRHPVVL